MKFENINAIIFDLDGTLLDTVDDLLDCVNFALSYFDYPLKTKEEVRLAVGDGLSKLMTRVLPNGGNDPNFMEAINLFKKHYIEIKASKTHPYDGIIELLEELKKRNIKIGVLSNKFDTGTKNNCKTFFKGLVDFAQGEDEYMGIMRKPNPVGLFSVIEKLNVKIENCLFVGDSDVDIKTAQNAGIPCISVLWGLKSEEFLINAGGKFFVKKPSEILDMI